ncbi:response regulator transcription factor [Paenibacillus qinlingensis]|uniref:DNA-binding NarL/FixJ family response regulator n=1 Tax=Paenibacillus qinlingensis TaxID=1837343 RepID=A0ABU1P3C5_9BACL|nr:response regulator transcription factor [Paenibacillus qinlingensis]MDR6554228.1 DNA-binding NarL/FixJ family response regulator [Paenibacillus qinlingensis]
MYSVVIADDRQIVRAGLHMLLEGCGSFTVMGEASDGNEAVALSLTLMPDLLLTDLKMPGVSIIEGSRKLKESLPHMKIIILTAFDESEDIYRAYKAGVDGYLMKDTSPETILASIHEVMRGTAIFQPKENRVQLTGENRL